MSGDSIFASRGGGCEVKIVGFAFGESQSAEGGDHRPIVLTPGGAAQVKGEIRLVAFLRRGLREG